MNSTQPWIRDRSWAFDFALCLVVAVFTAAPSVSSDPGAAALSCFLCLALLFRRWMPRVALAIGVAASLLQAVAVDRPLISLVVVPFLVYTLARWTDHLGRWAVLAGMVGSVIGPARWVLVHGADSSKAFYFLFSAVACAGVVSAAYLVGRRRHERVEVSRQRADSEVERQRLLISEQEQRTRATTIDERNRIARELHDIVAHSLSVIVVQAEGGKAIATKRPEKAPEVLGTIAETSREALEEMRRMVGLLRSGSAEPEQAAFLPTPGLEDIADLVRKTSDTAELSVFGPAPRVSRALGLTAYRIVQESLTNVLKHAGPGAQTRVTIAYTPASIELEVSDNGHGASATGDGLGHGLQGMHERVAIHGGQLSAQPRVGGGFVVRASLPYASEPSVPIPFPPGSRPRLVPPPVPAAGPPAGRPGLPPAGRSAAAS